MLEGAPLSCAICEIRKEKRFCPAVHGRICPQCCGEQREVTLDCPSDCPYLQQARQHERPRDASSVDREAMFPEVEIPEQFLYEHEQLILGLSYALAKSGRSQRSLDGHGRTDRDLIAALTSLVRQYQTLVQSSLIYQEVTANLAHQQIGREIEIMVK